MMLGEPLLVDTNRYADLVASDESLLHVLQHAADVYISLVTIGELLAGFAAGSRRRENEDKLGRFLVTPGIRTLLPDLATAHRYADISLDLRRQGTPIPTNDIWIAALALQHDLALDTNDKHFRHVPGLKLVDATP